MPVLFVNFKLDQRKPFPGIINFANLFTMNESYWIHLYPQCNNL